MAKTSEALAPSVRNQQTKAKIMRVFASTSATAVVPLRVASRRQACISRLRRVHTLPRLHYSVENGLGNFMSPKALRTIAVDYQGGLLTRLNELVQGELEPWGI